MVLARDDLTLAFHADTAQAPWAVTPWPSPLLISPLPKAVTKKHLAGPLLSVTQTATAYIQVPNQLQQCLYSKTSQTLFERGQAPSLYLSLNFYLSFKQQTNPRRPGCM